MATRKTRNHIYAYDEKNHKIIVIDGETGERVGKHKDTVGTILTYLMETGQTGNLRKFAIWCTHQSNEKIKPIQVKMLDLAEKAISCQTNTGRLEKLYEQTEGAAIATDTVGIPHGSSSAPAFLASRECINPDPYQGALQAARFHRLWHHMNERGVTRYLRYIEVETDNDSLTVVELAQIDSLLDIIGTGLQPGNRQREAPLQ